MKSNYDGYRQAGRCSKSLRIAVVETLKVIFDTKEVLRNMPKHATQAWKNVEIETVLHQANNVIHMPRLYLDILVSTYAVDQGFELSRPLL